MPSGSCLCQAVKYEYKGDPLAKAVCHCLTCRKLSSGSSTNVLIPQDHFHITSGEPKTFSMTHESGMHLTTHFCGNCGNLLYKTADREEFKGAVIVLAGTLDDPSPRELGSGREREVYDFNADTINFNTPTPIVYKFFFQKMPALYRLPLRQLGKKDSLVSRLGLGLMSAIGMYNAPLLEVDHLALLDEAYRRGETFWDTADRYGGSEETLDIWFATNPDKRQGFFLATKLGIRNAPREKYGHGMDSTPDYCCEAIETSVKRLGLRHVDLFSAHRLDKVTPIEKTIKVLVELKKARKIKYLSLSECSAKSLRRAHAIHPITPGSLRPLVNSALQSSRAALSNLERNVAVVDKVAELFVAEGATSAQLALA
ncbi:hypothetical protein BBP40_000941 [Aspergillus hancockii]|nr:hypothetical protein BBP40_000941 [Aspergillus hancockii]